MAKKCIPGVICIENITLVTFMVLTISLGYMYYYFNYKINMIEKHRNSTGQFPYSLDMGEHGYMNPHHLIGQLGSVSTRNMPFNDPYAPPLKNEMIHPRDSSDVRGMPPIRAGIPVNIKTQGGNMQYQQIGILTRANGRDDMILPIFGRKTMNSRDKWNYYTISNTGPINTKLPISVRGKSCTNDIGCDEIYNGDTVYVEGYKDSFVATVYENGGMSYIPFI
jgi:hypothetical protein